MTSAARILIVDDDRALATVVEAVLESAGYQTRVVHSAEAALAALLSSKVDLLLSDIRMDGMDGMELLEEVQKRAPDLPVVLMTAHGNVSLAVDAMKAGAADFVQKPFDNDALIFVLNKALQSQASEKKPPSSPAGVKIDSDVIAQNPAIREALSRLQKAAASQATVLLRGESGTGKEVFAKLLHQHSARKAGPFVAVHCAALPDNLLESELFGYEKGAFTGATQRKPGRVEMAQGGTLFLDEIGELTPAIQVKLLRLLQEKEYQALGSTSVSKADVRFVAATHRDLESMVREGSFREDLLYRLSVVPILIPPLRERREDIPALVQSFLAKFAKENAWPTRRIAPDAMELLQVQPWPGNVRQLVNFIERILVFAENETLSLAEVETELRAMQPNFGAAPKTSLPESSPNSSYGNPSMAPPSAEIHLDESRRDAEKQAIEKALLKAKNNRSQAARILGISRRTLYNKLSELGLEE